MPKHTPGPWKVRPDNYGGELHYMVVGQDNAPLFDSVNRSPGASEAAESSDLQLAAAAPELLESLKTILPHYRKLLGLHDPNTDTEWTTQAHNAIAKAGGAA